jgi:hypothetical protein
MTGHTHRQPDRLLSRPPIALIFFLELGYSYVILSATSLLQHLTLIRNLTRILTLTLTLTLTRNLTLNLVLTLTLTLTLTKVMIGDATLIHRIKQHLFNPIPNSNENSSYDPNPTLTPTQI